MKKIAVVLASLLIVACSSTPKTDTAQPAKPVEKINTSVAAPQTASVSAADVAASKLSAELQELQKHSAFFDFDKYAVKAEDKAAIQKQANFIKLHKDDVVTLEGNCDERGSDEYNMALGHKRAKAVEKALHKLGVPSGQIRTTSNGKASPRLACHEEKCWKENRRVDFVHSTK